MPATIAISTAARGLRSIVVARSVLAPVTRSCALLAVSEIFCLALSTALKTVVCRRGGLRANKFGHRRSQFRDVVAQCRKIGGEFLGSLFYRFNARHIRSPVLRGKVIRGCARGDPLCSTQPPSSPPSWNDLTLNLGISCSAHSGFPRWLQARMTLRRGLPDFALRRARASADARDLVRRFRSRQDR